MEKTATLNLRVNPTVKGRAEEVLAKLGIPMSTAIDMYLNQISLTGGIPFAVPSEPPANNTTAFSASAFCKASNLSASAFFWRSYNSASESF